MLCYTVCVQNSSREAHNDYATRTNATYPTYPTYSHAATRIASPSGRGGSNAAPVGP